MDRRYSISLLALRENFHSMRNRIRVLKKFYFVVHQQKTELWNRRQTIQFGYVNLRKIINREIISTSILLLLCLFFHQLLEIELTVHNKHRHESIRKLLHPPNFLARVK